MWPELKEKNKIFQIHVTLIFCLCPFYSVCVYAVTNLHVFFFLNSATKWLHIRLCLWLTLLQRQQIDLHKMFSVGRAWAKVGMITSRSYFGYKKKNPNLFCWKCALVEVCALRVLSNGNRNII